VAGSHDTETTVPHKEPVRRLGNANAEPDRISHKSTDQAAEIPPDGRETLPLIPVPVWNRHLLSQHTVFELQIALGLPAGHTLVGAVEPGPGRDRSYKYCGNRRTPALCNWLVEGSDPNALCIACRLNRTIPDLDDADNARYWGAIEVAKRRLVSQLLALGLPVKSKVEEDAERGLMFDFLRSPPNGPAVMTGHANGLITMNVEEADDVKREKIKHDLHEP
jgi:hypothetical protein